MNSFWGILKGEATRNNLVETSPHLKKCVTLANIYILLKGFYFPFHSTDAPYEEEGDGKVWANNSFPS